MSDDNRAELLAEVFDLSDLPTWAAMLVYGADRVKENEDQLKQAYTDQINEGMAFGL